MPEALEFLATLCACLFAGAAIYINVAEHPARMSLATSLAAAQWAPSYHRATWLQFPLAVVGFVSAVAAWSMASGRLWLVAGLFMGAIVPFTFLVIMPTNKRILEPGRDLGSFETRHLLERWGRLHAVRSLLSLIAAILMICASSRSS